MPRFLTALYPGVLSGIILCAPVFAPAANGIPGLYLTVPIGFTPSSSQNQVELVSNISFCSILWRETLTTSRATSHSAEDEQTIAQVASTTPITKGSFRANEVDYITWERKMEGPVTKVVGTGTCPHWSADGMESSIRLALEQAVLTRTTTEAAFAGLPFITTVPQGFLIKRRFANSIVLGGEIDSSVEEARITLSSLQIRQRELPFEELATTLLANQTSLTDIVVTSQQNVAVNGLRGHHLLAAGNANDLAARIHQVLIGNAESLVLITLTIPSHSGPAEERPNLAAENNLLANLMTSLRFR